jgi:hypothetical protein
MKAEAREGDCTLVKELRGGGARKQLYERRWALRSDLIPVSTSHGGRLSPTVRRGRRAPLDISQSPSSPTLAIKEGVDRGKGGSQGGGDGGRRLRVLVVVYVVEPGRGRESQRSW